jgi:hypothetical protein
MSRRRLQFTARISQSKLYRIILLARGRIVICRRTGTRSEQAGWGGVGWRRSSRERERESDATAEVPEIKRRENSGGDFRVIRGLGQRGARSSRERQTRPQRDFAPTHAPDRKFIPGVTSSYPEPLFSRRRRVHPRRGARDRVNFGALRKSQALGR